METVITQPFPILAIIFGLILIGILVGIIFASLALQEWEDRLVENVMGLNQFSPSPADPNPNPQWRREQPGSRRREKEVAKNTRSTGGLVLSGFDTSGARMRVIIERPATERSRWGLTFGRDAGLCDHVIADSAGSLSRRHFRISWNGREQCYEIEDLQSAAGTRVNGRALSPFQKIAVPLPAKIDVGGRAQFDLTKG